MIFGLGINLTAQADDWDNISRNSGLSLSSKRLQQSAREISNAVGLEDRSLMVQIYQRQTNFKENFKMEELATRLLREVYWGPMAPLELKIQEMTGTTQDLEASLSVLISDLPEVSERNSRNLASALKTSYMSISVVRLAYELTAEGGRCVGLLLITKDQKQVVEVANCKTN